MEKEIEQHRRDKSLSELRKIQNVFLGYKWRKVIKQTGAQNWRTFTVFVKFPVWFAVMETIRRMTGTEDGMPSLAAKSLTALKRKQDIESGTMDQLISIEPSLATEGMLWFDDLMIPDPSLILPFALSGIMFMMFSTRRGTISVVGLSPEAAKQAHSWNLWKGRHLKLAALAVGPATLMFPSAMLLYWISSSLAAVMVDGIVGLLLRTRIIIRVTRGPGKGKPGEAKPKSESKPKMQIYRGPTMKDLQNQKRKKK